MSFFDTVFSVVQEFFEFLFASGSPEYKKKQEIKQITRRLKSMQPPLYRHGGFLLPAFATALYQLYQSLNPVEKTIAASISNQDKRISEKCRDFILETALSPEEKKLRISLNYANRLSELTGAQNAEAVIEQQGKQFAQYLKLLETEPFKKSAEVLENLDALKDLCDFNFQGILAVFDPATQAEFEKQKEMQGTSRTDTEQGEQTKLNFQIIPVSEVIPQLLDLNFLLQRLDLSHKTSDAMALLSAFVLHTQTTEEMHAQFSRIFQMLAWQIKNKVSPAFILDVVRLEKGDPSFTPENPERENNLLQQYKTKLSDIFHSDSKKLLQSAQENETLALIEKTFGKLPLEPIEGYNKENSALIEEISTDSFEWVLPLQLIKTFSLHFLEEKYRTILNAIIVEGFFVNRPLQSTFAASFFFCTGILQKIEEFESLFSNNRPFSIPVILSYVDGIKNGGDFEKQLHNAVENANVQAKNLVQQCASNYAGLLTFAETVLEESKKPMPDVITNIKTLTTSTKNGESFKLLENDIQIFKNFLELMKKYAIIPADSSI